METRELNVLLAVNIVEGWEDPIDEQEVLAAWQYLVDEAVVWKLQGSLGRMAKCLIEQGKITLNNEEKNASQSLIHI